MSEENKIPETEEQPFQLTDEDKKFLEDSGYTADEIANITSKEAFDKAKANPKNTNTPDSPEKGNDQPNADEQKPNESDGENKGEQQKPLIVNIDNGEEKQPENEDITWIAKKAQYYETLAKNNEIQGYEQDTTQPSVFCAKFNNSTIRYSSPDEVTVSKDAEFKAFDTICKDPDNKGRPIEFPENQSEAFYARMYAACALNGNPMTGAVPEKINFDELKNSGLTPEQIQQVKKVYNKQHQGEDVITKTSPEELKKQIKEALKDEVEYKKLMSKMAVTKDGKYIGGNERWLELHKDKEKRKKFLAEQYRENPDIMKEAMAEALKEKESENDKDDRKSIRQTQKEAIESSMTDEQKQTRQEKLSERDKVLAARLGLTPEYTTKDKNGNMVIIGKDENTETLMKNRYNNKEGGYDAFTAKLKAKIGKVNE